VLELLLAHHDAVLVPERPGEQVELRSAVDRIEKRKPR